MTVLNFPASPALNATYTANNVTYTWNGNYWEANNTGSLDNIYVEVAGDVMTGNLQLPGGGGNTAALQKQEITDLPVSTFDNDSGYITSSDIPPGTVSYWKKDGSDLKPVSDTDNVNIGDGKITLSATNSSSSQPGDIKLTGNLYAGTPANGAGVYNNGAFVANTTDSGITKKIILNGGGNENFTVQANGCISTADNILIGGILPTDPNTSLLLDGSFNFADKVTFNATSPLSRVTLTNPVDQNADIAFFADGFLYGTVGYKGPTGGLAIDYRGSQGFSFESAGVPRANLTPFGDLLIGDTLPADPAIKLAADGTANFKSINAGGIVNITSTSTSAALIFNDSNTNPSNYPLIGSEGDSLRLRGGSVNDAVYIDSARDVLIGGSLPADPAIRLQASGVGYFKGAVNVINETIGGGQALLNLQSGTTLTENGTQAGIALGGGTGSHTSYIFGGHKTAGETVLLFLTDDFGGGAKNAKTKMMINSNGEVYIGGDLSNLTSPAPKITLKPSGDAVYDGTINNPYYDQANTSGGGFSIQSYPLGASRGGSIRCQNSAGVNNYTAFQVWDGATPSGNWRQDGTIDIGGTLTGGGGGHAPNIILNAPDGIITATNVTFNLGAGATLDVKESIETAVAARQAIRETFQELRVAVQSATDFGELKAAMLVALEDYAV